MAGQLKQDIERDCTVVSPRQTVSKPLELNS